MELSDLEGIAGGRVWTGTEALDLGLVDETGGFREALRKARELGGIRRVTYRVLTRSTRPEADDLFPEPAQAALDAIGEMWLALSELRAGGSAVALRSQMADGFSSTANSKGTCIERDPQQGVDRRAMAGLSAGHLFTDLNQEPLPACCLS